MADLETKLPAVPGTDVPAAMFISPMASSFSADAAFGLTRVVARPYCKGSFVLACNAAGNWVPQQGPSAPVVFFQHGVNDTFTTGTNPLAQSGISGQYAQRSIEITNSQYNGGFSMKYSALILGIGIVQERIRRLAYSASVNVGATPFAGPYTAPGYVSRAGGIVNDNDWNLSDRLLSSILGASELQLLPMAQNTDCPLLLGVIQLFDSSRIGGMYGGPEVSQTTPDYRWRFRDDILVTAGIQGNTAQPNQIQVAWLDGVIGSIGKLTGSASATEYTGSAGDLLALDVIMVVDVAFGLQFDKGAVLPTTPPTVADVPTFVFATEFDARKYDCYRGAV
jgi:hypothetical protein